MRADRLLALCIVVGACASVGAPELPSSSAAPEATSTAPTSTLPPVVECPGSGEFEEGRGIAALEGEGSDSRALGRIRWETSEQCETFRFEFETEEGAPATTIPDIRVGHLDSFQVIRIDMGVQSTVITDQIVETGLVDRLYVVRSLDGGLFVDLHLRSPAAARVGAESSPGALVVDLRPGFVPIQGTASTSERLVLISPTADGDVPPELEVSGYSRTFEANVTLIVTQGGAVISETSTTAADWVETWGEFRTDTLAPPGEAILFVGEESPEDGTLDGITVELMVR